MISDFDQPTPPPKKNIHKNFIGDSKKMIKNYEKQDSKVSKGCAVLIELETLRNTKKLSVFNDVFSPWTIGL